MAAVSAKLVKDLRDKTGAGMMDCKKALAATDGDANKAVEWLRQKGIASAEKKSGRTAAEGAISSYIHTCLLYTSPSPRDGLLSRMPSSA